MEIKDSQNLVERIVELLQIKEKKSDEFLRSSLEKFNQRLENIESNFAVGDSKFQVKNSNLNHSSADKFVHLEELAVENVNGLKDEKACPFEPAGKPCDHCAMCNSRGF